MQKGHIMLAPSLKFDKKDMDSFQKLLQFNLKEVILLLFAKSILFGLKTVFKGN